ncbi:hypothetical protein A2442_03720 [Candidatus Campbellbacteria bacterium RIFOXYC2_FULL_35_25]|uniref:Uncharacterized protein n=1 Tax=Candidatus Campbellbacteria bacterium RIFOXYC2_FULL_35_25 TaxID=1797582 RepID=A0A1F5EKB8_9BACT|nr:MAG: hypothetical protein A2442_03720 [Candidatus Campbellbacteria bacterium RIFOXYC2_FULL_35_25]
MPELPEVQTIVNDLNKKVVDQQIIDFWSDWKKNVRPSFLKFKKKVSGAKILGVRRRGKHIVIDLGNKNSIIIHLKMSGHLLYKPTADSLQLTARRNFGSAKISSKNDYFEERVNQYVHHKFSLKSGATLEFSDMRKFGWLWVVATDEVENIKEIKKLGIDAMSENFSLKILKDILKRKVKSIIGIVLLDQGLIAGIGNIYRSEILFEAEVNPKRKILTLKEKEIEKIFKAINLILKKAVRMRGTSDVDYRDTEGKPGSFQNVLRVYGRDGERCLGCRGLVIREKLGQRSIFFCPKCQK